MALRKKKPPRRRRDPFGFIDPKLALATILEATKEARQEKVAIVLIGGLAVRFYGSPRLTDDIDFAAETLPTRVAGVGIPLPFGGVRVWTPSAVELNFIVRTDEAAPLYRDVVKSARRTRWGFKVARPEHLVAMKLEADRDVDRLDVAFLLAKRGLVDRRKARALVRRFLGARAVKDFNEACRRAGRSS